MAGKFGESNYIITDRGHKTILDLYNYQTIGKAMPKILTFTEGYTVTDISTFTHVIYLNGTEKLIEDTDYTIEDLRITFIPISPAEHRLETGTTVLIHITDDQGSSYDIRRTIGLDDDLDHIDITDEININTSQRIFFRDQYTITKVTDVELLQTRFADHLASRISDITCSSDTSVYQYDVVNVTNEPIIDKTKNVFQYLANNHAIIQTLWNEIRLLNSYGVKMPNLTFSDIITVFLDKDILTSDAAYTITDTISHTAIPIFINRNINHSNFILAK